MELPPDHRLKRPSTYSREAAIVAVTDLYESLTTPLYVEPTDILYPPPGGWPHITRENEAFASLNKTDEVLELLRHLPYLDSRKNEWFIRPWSVSCDYVNRDPRNYRPLVPDEFEFPPWVINLTFSGRYGQSLMFDTSDGTATEHDPNAGIYEPDYPEGDPRYWRVECEEETEPLVERLDLFKQRFQNLNWIPHVQKIGSWPRVFEWYEEPNRSYGDGEGKAMREIYLEHGWPDSFDREACQASLEIFYYDVDRRKELIASY
ncbi:hypothetical protein N7532_005777 [Penicillium argentinense]|uniref:Uncharacterized protein n=1 Tax=Penicillium argentinense TaxID=1131581 RepID=A0A9W9KAQ0_9EURO|nr:uncharacterized protein N7532_005777 [Penicillium argentinense]KAJ5098776.1 hypothetical protein N7532_005777 [Penicillium argentinense]